MEWIARQGLHVDREVTHLDLQDVQPGDTVVGTLPVHLAAMVCRHQAAYVHLAVNLPEEMRGVELDARQLQVLSATLQRFEIKPIP